MLISLLLIAIAAAGGVAVTYLIEDDAPLMWRIAAGNVIGCAIFGTAAFVLALGFGLKPAVLIGAGIIALAPVLLFYADGRRLMIRKDWSRAKERWQGAGVKRLLRFAYYAAFFLLFFFFFDRAMLVGSEGIYTGGSQNLGDLPFHLGAIFSFTEGNNFPPQNPSFAGARFSYPFIADLLTACYVKLGANVRDAMFVQNMAWALSLLVVLERFVFKVTNDRIAARIAPVLLFFTGGLGFIWFLGDYWSQSRSLFDFLWHIPKDYTIGDGFRWGNSMVVLFVTQRSLLLGMPLTLIVLGYLWKVFSSEAKPRSDSSLTHHSSLITFAAGLLAGLLPLIHLHSLAVLFVVGVFLFVLKPERWMTWITFAAGVAMFALPELAWSMSGSATETSKFFAWHFGWDKGDKNFLLFWFMNTGIFIPILLAGIYLVHSASTRERARSNTSALVEDEFPQSRKAAKKKGNRRTPEATNSPLTTHHSPLFFYLPFAFLFIVSNVAKLAPWEWDNIKVLIYWFVGSVSFVALFVAWLWRKHDWWFRVAAVLCIAVLIFSGVLDVWRATSGQINYKVFDKDAVEVAEQVKRRTPADALFLNAPTYNTAVVLTGRQSLMRYPGHLGSHGIDYGSRESDVKRIYQGGVDAGPLLEKYGIRYVMISPEERNLGAVNEQFFSRYAVAAESGQYRVYKIK